MAAGLSTREIGRRLARHQLVATFPGVYAPGHLHLDRHGHRTAAALSVRGSSVTHGSATDLHGVGGGGARWHVTVEQNGGRRPTRRIVIHTSTTLLSQDIAVVSGLPTTTLARAIVDAANHLPERQMANVLARAERASLLDIAAIGEVMTRVRNRPTAAHAVLTAAVGEHIRLGAQLSRSDVEGALRDIAVAAGIPPPRLNRMVGGDEVDALWPTFRLGIEIDSWEFHRDRRSFVADRADVWNVDGRSNGRGHRSSVASGKSKADA